MAWFARSSTEPSLKLHKAFIKEFASYKEAFRREQQIKRWSRAKKEALIAGKLDQLKTLAKKKER